MNRPTTPPTRVEPFHGKSLLWWFGESLHTHCGNIDIVLHHHPHLFPEAPWSVEIFGTRGKDEFFHYSGQQFPSRPSDDQFRVCARSFLEAMHGQGDL